MSIIMKGKFYLMGNKDRTITERFDTINELTQFIQDECLRKGSLYLPDRDSKGHFKGQLSSLQYKTDYVDSDGTNLTAYIDYIEKDGIILFSTGYRTDSQQFCGPTARKIFNELHEYRNREYLFEGMEQG